MPGPVSDSYDPVFSTADNAERWVVCCRAAARALIKKFKIKRVDADDLAYAMAEAAHEIYRDDDAASEEETA